MEDIKLVMEPITLRSNWKGRQAKWPFPKMEVGEVFYITNKGQIATVRASLAYWNRHYKREGRRFASELNNGILRVQRIS